MHERVAGRVLPWSLRFPRNGRLPGDGGLWLTPRDHLDALLGARRSLLAGARDDVRAHDVATLARRGAILLDLVTTCARGMLRDRVSERGFDALDDEDLRAWLLRHGARPDTARSAVLKTAYDLCFASAQGPAANSGFAAGVGLRFFLRAFLGYKGAVGWPMNAGTGDVLVAPLYELLRRRGVTFSFFQRVRSLDLCPSARALQSVTLGTQARLTDGYDPLVDVRGLPCWPAAPRWEQLADAARLCDVDLESYSADAFEVGAETLVRGRDFDDAVLAVGVAALPALCPALVDAPRWRAMLSRVQTAATMGLQTWTATSRGDGPPLMGNSGLPTLAGVGDMSRLLPREDWPDARRPGHILHACHRVEDGGDASIDEVRRVAEAWLANGGAAMIPGAPEPADLDARYLRLNIDPSDRYALSVPGSTRHRLGADESGVDGLVLADVWTRTGLNLGAIEAAVMSGMQAARAVCGEPRAVPGEHG